MTAETGYLRTPEQVAEIFQKPASTIKDLARRRKIPFVLIGGSYRFTDQHVAEIIARFECRPEEEHRAASQRPRRRTATPPQEHATPLRARRPRRRGAA